MIQFVKTNPDAKIPVSNHNTDSGYDVFAVEDKIIPAKGKASVDVGLQFAYIPRGYWVKVEGRSGLSFKHSILPHPGIIDSEYRGPAGILLYNHGNEDYKVHKGDKIAQFVIYKLHKVGMGERDSIIPTDRGEKGFGSSGR